MGDFEVVKTGLPFLDSLLGGGFLPNSIIVVSFQPGTVVRQFNLLFTLKKIEENFYVIHVTFHYPFPEIVDWIKIASGVPEFYGELVETRPTSDFNIIDCFNIPREADWRRDNVRYVSNPFRVNELLSVMAEVRESVPEDRRVYWYFPHLTNMSIGVSENDLVKFCRRAFRFHKLRGDLAFYLFNENAHSERFFAKLYQLSDVFVKLTAEEKSRRIETCVQVIKSILPFETRRVPFNLTEIQPIPTEPGGKPSRHTGRMSAFEEPHRGVEGKPSAIRTGIPELDSLLGGGFLSNSIIVTSHQYGVRTQLVLTQLLRNHLHEKTHVIQVNFHLSPEEYITRFKIHEQSSEIYKMLADSLSKDKISFIDCFTPHTDETKTGNNIYQVSNPFDTDKLLSVMTRVRNNVPKDKSALWIFHSLTGMNIGVPEDELAKFCRRAFRYHKYCGDLAFYVMAEQAHSKRFHALLFQLSDVFIKFMGENTPEGIDTSIQILKGVFRFNSKKTKYTVTEKGEIKFSENQKP